MSDYEPDARFPEPDESEIRPGETHAEWTRRNADAATEAAKTDKSEARKSEAQADERDAADDKTEAAEAAELHE